MKKTHRISCLVAAFVLACLFGPRTALANLQEVAGIGPKATAMGNAFSAVADDFSAAYYNPAGLGQIDYHKMTLGYLYCHPSMRQYLLSSAEKINAENRTNFHSILFGTIVDLSRIFDTRGHNFVLGMATTVGDDFRAAWRTHDYNPQVPQFIRYGNYANRAHIYTSLGLEVRKETLYLGAGINFWQDISAPSIRLKMNLEDQAIVNREFDIDGQSEISPIFGVLFKPLPWLSLAYTYREQWSQKLPTNITEIVLVNGVEILPVQISFTAKDYFLPWNMTFGVAVQPDDRLLVALDLTYYHWSDFDQPMWRGKYPEWNNTLVPRLGVQYKLSEEVFLRSGYYYETSPVPDQGGYPSNYLDFNKHVFSAGVGLALKRLPLIGDLPLIYKLELDAFGQYQVLDDRTQTRPSPEENWRIEGHQYALGLGITTGF
jgi:long-chain fatty acid transport protein